MEKKLTDDGALLARYVADGDEQAFRELVERHAGLVLGSARRRIGDAGLAEEVAQNVFALMARKGRELVEHPCLGAWLHQTTRWECVRVRRNEKRRERTMRAYEVESRLNRDGDGAAWEQVAPVIEQALDGLGERDRRLVMLRYVEGRRVREVAGILGKSEAAVRKQAQRVLGRLAAVLKRRGVGVSGSMLAGGLLGRLVDPAPAAVVEAVAERALGAAASGGTVTTAGLAAVAPWAAVVVAIGMAAAPVVIQGGRIVELKRELELRTEQRRIAPPAVGGGGGKVRNEGGRGGGARGGRRMTAFELVELMLDADIAGDAPMLSVLEEVGDLGPEELVDLLGELDGLEKGGRTRGQLRELLVGEFLMLKEPGMAARYAVRREMAEGLTARSVERWADTDRAAMLEWLDGIQAGGGIGSKGWFSNTEGAIWGGLAGAMVKAGELDAALEVARGLPDGVSGPAVGAVSEALARSGDTESFLELFAKLETTAARRSVLSRWVVAVGVDEAAWTKVGELAADPGIPEAERVGLVVGFGTQVTRERGPVIDRILKLVPERRRDELAREYFYHGAFNDPEPFASALDGGEVPVELRDAALAGFAKASMHTGRMNEALRRVRQISDGEMRTRMKSEMGIGRRAE